MAVIQAPQPEDTTGIPCRSALPDRDERRGPNKSQPSTTGSWSPASRQTRGAVPSSLAVITRVPLRSNAAPPKGSPVTLKHHLGRPAS